MMLALYLAIPATEIPAFQQLLQLRTSFHFIPYENIVQMELNRIWGNAQNGGDLAIGVTQADKRSDILLAHC